MKKQQKKKNASFKDVFTNLSKKIARAVGSPWVFFLAVFFIIAWLVLGPFFDFSNTWQLFVNSLTTIVTFFMVFIIQNTQNRESDSTQLKLDELINILNPNDNIINIEDLNERDIEKLKKKFGKELD